MKSLIIIEVVHGEDTDGVQSMMEDMTSDPNWFGDGSLMITDSTLRVDLPGTFLLDSDMPSVADIYKTCAATPKE